MAVVATYPEGTGVRDTLPVCPCASTRLSRCFVTRHGSALGFAPLPLQSSQMFAGTFASRITWWLASLKRFWQASLWTGWWVLDRPPELAGLFFFAVRSSVIFPSVTTIFFLCC